jgi:outer membrane immunogenic protein
MKKLTSAILAGAGLTLAATAMSFAADLPAPAMTYKAMPPAAPAFSWTGFYLGGNVGYGWATDDPGTISFYQPVGVFAGSIPGINSRLNGVIGGGQIGYNQQINNFVVGLEGDFSGTGMKGSVTDNVNTYTASTQINWLATVRGRAGVAFDRTLVYATGGLAIASVKTTLNDTYPGFGIITTASTPTYVGWTIGGGIEMALYSNWTARVEYLYLDLGSKQNTFNEPPPGWPAISSNASVSGNLVRVGLNYKFN